MTAMKDDLLKATGWALDDEWDSAHRIVQQYETDAIASWIHAVLHKSARRGLGSERFVGMPGRAVA